MHSPRCFLQIRGPGFACCLLLLLAAPLARAQLGDALNAPDLVWTSSGDAPWFVDNNNVDCNCLRYPMGCSGRITNNQCSTLQTTVTGPGRFTFWWKVSCQPTVDYLAWSLNGSEQARISGPNALDCFGWLCVTQYLDSGPQTLQWSYVKGSSGSGGQDAGWVDHVSYTPGLFPPVITAQPTGLNVLPGANATFTVAVSGAPPFAYQWQYNGTNLANATDSSLTLSNTQPAQSGLYRVAITNAYGWVMSSNALLNVFLSVGPAQPQDALERWYFRSPSPVTRVRYVGGLFFGLGPGGLLTTSPDGTVWTTRNSGTTASLSGVAYGAGPLLPYPSYKLFVVVGSGGTLLTSQDGVTWSPVSATTRDLNDVAWNGSRFVATTTADSSNPTNVFYSLDGLHWTGVTFPSNPDTGYPFITSALGVVNGYSITAGGSAFAFNIWRSSTGSTWRYVGFSDAVVTGIASGNGCTIIVGWEGWPRVSTDQGATWVASVSSAIGSTNVPAYPMVGSDIVFGNGIFLVPRGFLCNGLLTTTDGVTWAKRDVFVGSYIQSAAFGNGTFVVTCSGSAFGAGPAYPVGIYQSSPVAVPFITLARQTNPAAVALTASGEIGRAYRLQTSSDLKNWSDRSSYTYSTNGFQYVDPLASGPAQVFYRAVSP